MAKKLIEYKKTIDSSGIKFYKYLHDLIQDDIINKLDEISLKTDVYLFSGIIRNYFLHVYLKRDIDVVIGNEIDVYKEFEGETITKNSFGGYKILYPSGPLDIWYIKDTWAFQNQKTLDFSLEKAIPRTAFFNFSAIIFSLNKKEFYYTKHFLNFLKDKKLDYVYQLNANYPLCIINTFYYSDKYNLKIADRLFLFIKDLYEKKKYDYKSIQLKHFGEVLYSDEQIKNRINSKNEIR